MVDDGDGWVDILLRCAVMRAVVLRVIIHVGENKKEKGVCLFCGHVTLISPLLVCEARRCSLIITLHDDR